MFLSNVLAAILYLQRRAALPTETDGQLWNQWALKCLFSLRRLWLWMVSIWPLSSSPLPRRPLWLLVLNRGTLTGCLMKVALRQKAGLLNQNAVVAEDLSFIQPLLKAFQALVYSRWMKQTSHGHLASQGPGRAFRNQVQQPWNLHLCHLSCTLSVSQMAVRNYPSKGVSGKPRGPRNKVKGRQMNYCLGT